MKRADVVVIGAGVIGCAIARFLARAGAQVLVIDSGEPGGRASWAAAGMLAPQAEADGEDPFLRLLLASRERFRGLVHELEEETGLGVGYRTEGMLVLAFDAEEEVVLEEREAWQMRAGLEVERLTPGQLRGIEPALSPGVRAALRFAGDHQVENRALVRALWASAAAAGAVFRIGQPVVRFEDSGGGIRLALSDGGRIDAGQVVLAAGSWSSLIANLPRPLPVEPVHGQLISVLAAPPLIRHCVAAGHGYLVPRADGTVIAGTTAERIGYSDAVTPAGLLRILPMVVKVAPTLAARPIVGHWSGLRPGTPDGIPIVGRDPEHPGLIYATGHYRNGILLAPITAEIVGRLAAGEAARGEDSFLAVTRFEGGRTPNSS